MPGSTINSYRKPTALTATTTLVIAMLGLLPASPAHADTLPSPDHVVVVVMENHGYDQIIGNSDAPYLNSLAGDGATLTHSYALTHPSQPNYYALFSGDTQGITDDSCVTPGFGSADNLGSELIAQGSSWASYNEGLPAQGDTSCTAGDYAQKHNPWFGFSNVPTDTAYTFDQFPADFATLPKVSFVIPDICDDMHGPCGDDVANGDSWLQNNLGAYAAWAKAHNSLLIVTFDEDDDSADNHIPTIVYGQHVAPGSTSDATYNHYDVLHTLEDLAGLTTHAGNSASASDITGIWN